jgi:serine/threonine-protein kinase RsbT
LVVEKSDTIALISSDDVVKARQAVRAKAIEAGFGIVDQTKLVTAASEVARNTVDYGGGGILRLDILRDGSRRGVQLTFCDNGPGIADIKTAMTDGYTTGGGLGLGLSGAKRLSNEFSIESTPGMGTTVTLARWKL